MYLLSVSTLKNTHLKSPCLSFRALQCVTDCFDSTQVREGSHIRTSRYAITGPYQSQWKLLFFLLYPSGVFYFPFIIFICLTRGNHCEPLVFSLWAKTIPYTFNRACEDVFIISVWPHPICLGAALIHKLKHKPRGDMNSSIPDRPARNSR